MINYYLIEIIKIKTVLKIGYRSGKFVKLEKKRGKLADHEVKSIGSIIPPTEAKILAYKNYFKGRVNYEAVVKQKSLFTKFSDAWFGFYESYAQMPPKFTAVEGNALKQIINYLKQITSNETEAFQVWNLVLSKWKQLDDFHQKNTDLKYINGNINRILNNVKRISTQNNGGVNDDYLRKIMHDLQSK